MSAETPINHSPIVGSLRTERRNWRPLVLIGGIVILSLAAIGAFNVWNTVVPVKSVAEYPLIREVRYRFTLRNTTNRVKRDLLLRASGPLLQTSFHLSHAFHVDTPFNTVTTERGNQSLEVKIPLLAPHAGKIVEVRASLKVNPQAQPLTLKDPSSYLAAERYVELEDPEVKKLARRFADGTPIARARAIYTWVAENIVPTAYLRRPLGAAHTLENRAGDCTEFAYLFAALSRANGLPTRVMGGYRYQNNAFLKAEDYHNWAEVYIDGAWRVADPHGRRFMQEEDSYLAMTDLSASIEHSLSAGLRFSVNDPKVSVRMQ